MTSSGIDAYTVASREDALDFMADYPGYGEQRWYTSALAAEQVSFSWRRMLPRTPHSSRVAALIDRHDAAWNAQDLDAIASTHDHAIVFHIHTAGERVGGAAAVRAHIGAIFARWPTLRFQCRSLRCGDDFAVSEWTARAVHPDDGRRLEWDGVRRLPAQRARANRRQGRLLVTRLACSTKYVEHTARHRPGSEEWT